MSDPQKLDRAVQAILRSYQDIGGINHLHGSNLPSRHGVSEILDLAVDLLFPGYFSRLDVDTRELEPVTRQKTQHLFSLLSQEVFKSLVWESRSGHSPEEVVDGFSAKATTITEHFLAFFPELRQILKEDVIAIYEGDPAAKSEPEIILAYPGFYGVTVYRIAHFLYGQQVPLIPRMMTEICHSVSGIDIHPGAKIGRRFCIDHGTGVVIGETAVIGNNVKLYQGVTIGALSVTKASAAAKRHPTLEDNVTVYARTTILGGDTVIGQGSVIGGNVWLTKSVPPNSTIYLTPDLKQKIRTSP